MKYIVISIILISLNSCCCSNNAGAKNRDSSNHKNDHIHDASTQVNTVPVKNNSEILRMLDKYMATHEFDAPCCLDTIRNVIKEKIENGEIVEDSKTGRLDYSAAFK